MSDPTLPAPDGVPVSVSGVPAGLAAFPDLRAGKSGRDRRGRMKVDRVRLTAAPGAQSVQPGDPVPGLADTDAAWFAAHRRRWTSITARHGTHSVTAAEDACRGGVITVHATVNHDLRLNRYTATTPTPPWAAWYAARATDLAAHADTWTQRAAAAADSIADLDTDLASALRTIPGRSPQLPVLVHAAEALADGTVFDGPRAFSQAFFGDTKSRDDVPAILTRNGANPTTLAALGLTRSPYLGAGGPLTARLPGRRAADLAGYPGPTQFRVHPDLQFTTAPDTDTLLIIENLQAAETICDRYPQLAVLWCAGQPSNTALDVIARTTGRVRHVAIATDADLGGVRIAHRIAAALNDHLDITILDAGTSPHPEGGLPFGPASHDALRHAATSDSLAAPLAQACLTRGYRVEQEAVIRACIATHLAIHHRRSG